MTVAAGAVGRAALSPPLPPYGWGVCIVARRAATGSRPTGGCELRAVEDAVPYGGEN